MLFFHKSPLSTSCEKIIYLSDDNLSFIIIAATPYRFWQPSHPERNSSRKRTRNTAAITAMDAYFVKRDMRGIAFVVKVWLFFWDASLRVIYHQYVPVWDPPLISPRRSFGRCFHRIWLVQWSFQEPIDWRYLPYIKAYFSGLCKGKIGRASCRERV